MYETLSRYLAGELTPAEAEAVRRRIEAEPAWAKAWEIVAGLPDALAALPQPAPPPALDQAIVERWSAPPVEEAPPLTVSEREEPPPVRVPARRIPTWALAAPALLAAAVLGALLTPQHVPEVTVSAGTQHLSGEVHLLAGDTRIELDGIADVTVQPADLHARAEDEMNRTHLLSAAVGSVVTLAVTEGIAVVRHGDDAPVTVRAGERRTVGAGGADAAAGDRARIDADAEARIGALEDELEDLRLRYALVKGQLDGRMGQPLDFPPDLPAGYHASDFEARARSLTDDVPGTELVRTECDEYPCVAYYRSTSGDPQWTAALGQALSREYGEQAGIFQLGLRVEDGGAVAAFSAVAVIPTDDADLADAVRARLNPRTEGTMNELEAEERARHVAP